jgi:hypothetical protein
MLCLCTTLGQDGLTARLLVVRICATRPRQALDLRGCGRSRRVGRGACARLTVWVRCARTPSRISVHDRAVRPAGDMMVDGVIPLGEALRPLGRWRPSTRTWRQDDAGSRPRCIGVSEGCARKPRGSGGLQRLVAELAQGVVAALEQLARDREAGAVAAESLGRLEVVVAIGAAVPAG